MIYSVYKITCKINGMVYIGCTSNFKQRCWDHKTRLKRNEHRNKYLQEDYDRYGLDNFEFKILAEVGNKDDAYFVEENYTELCRANERSYGYNIQTGNKLSEEQKKKISIAHKGNKMSEEKKRKLLEANQKPISQYDKNNNFIRDWISATYASRSLNIDRGGILNCCRGKLKSAGGFKWQFKKIREINNHEK